MLYFLSLSLSLILIPVAMVFFGLLWRKSPPRGSMNCAGTDPRSKQSQEAWDFAHAYHARVWLYSGLALLVLTAVALALLANKENYLTYFMVIMAVRYCGNAGQPGAHRTGVEEKVRPEAG